ncbi:MAG: hypothetical protein IKL10_06780 [Clostridia bacterium]|nr:hypothetical protein [Clostridia bacterium]
MDMNLLHFSEGEGVTSENTAIAEEGQAAENEDTSPDEEFNELIKGKYADAFKKRTQSIIDKRFSKMKGYEKTALVCAPLIESLQSKFPDIEKADTEALVRAYLESEKNESKAEKTESEKPSPVLQAAQEHLKKRAAHALSLHLSEEEKKLREIYPSFDLQREYASSPELRSLLASGVGLRRAFETVNLEKIMGSALRYAVMKAGKSTADAMKAPGRVTENSLSDRASSIRRTDVKNLTEKEIMKIISEVSKGAKITF